MWWVWREQPRLWSVGSMKVLRVYRERGRERKRERERERQRERERKRQVLR